MKKHLLLAAVGLTALISAPTAAAYDLSVVKAPVTSLTNEGFYYIYDAHGDDGTTTEVNASNSCRYAFRYDSGANDVETAAIHGTHTKPKNSTDQLENKHVWQALAGEDNTWKFKNVATGRYLAKGSAQSTSVEANYGSFELEPVSNSTGVFTVKIQGTNNRWDGNGGGTNPMVYWAGSGHHIHFYAAVANGEDGYQIDSDNGWNVTYSYTMADNTTTSTQTIQVADGANAADQLPNLSFHNYFTATGLAESNTTVGDGNVTFTVQGTWNFPMAFNNVYRVRCKPNANGNSVVTYNAETATVTTNTGTGSELEANRFWFFKFVRYNENGDPVMTMHTLADKEKGLEFHDNNTGSSPVLSETPTELTLVKSTFNNSQPNDFVFSFGANNANYTNDRLGKFSSWQSAAAVGDASLIRLSSLTEDDYTKFATTASEDLINKAKENPTPENIIALLEAYNQNPVLIAIAAAKEYPIGSNLGQFNNENMNFEALLESAQEIANKVDATDEEIQNAIASIAVSTLRINQPKAGRFYRFHYGNAYMSTEANSDDRFTIVTENNADNLNHTTVFYYDGTHLVTFPEGLVMGNLTSNNKANGSYKGVLSTNNNVAGNVSFVGSTIVKGEYNITFGSRYLYHAANQIDAGTNAGSNADAGYRWNITEVSWLPIPHDDSNEYLSIFSPVELGLDYNEQKRVTPYQGVIQGNTLGKYEIENAVIPANTPVLLKYNTGISNGCVYLPVNYNGSAATYADEPATDTKGSDLKGGIFATAKEDNMSYFTTQNNSFAAHTEEYIPGFSAHLAVDSESANADGYTIGDYITTSISEIEKTADAAATEVYDLQGRRVSKAGRGIFIVNGKKMFVK